MPMKTNVLATSGFLSFGAELAYFLAQSPAR